MAPSCFAIQTLQQPELCPFLCMEDPGKTEEGNSTANEKAVEAMSAGEKKKNEGKAMEDLLTSLQDLLKAIEDSFLKMGTNLQNFTKKVTEIKQSYVSENTKKRVKRIPKKKRPTSKELLKNEEPSSKENAEKIINNQKDDILEYSPSLFILEQPPLKKEVPQTIDLTYTLNPTLDIDMNDWFLETEQEKDKQPLKKQFYENELARLKRSDPSARESDIKKFIQSSWTQMGEAERTKYFQNCNKKKDPSNTKLIKKAVEKTKEEDLNKFSRFLDKKANKSGVAAVETPKPKKQYIANVQSAQAEQSSAKNVSASLLLSALQKNKQAKESTNLSGIGWTFQNFQI